MRNWKKLGSLRSSAWVCWQAAVAAATKRRLPAKVAQLLKRKLWNLTTPSSYQCDNPAKMVLVPASAFIELFGIEEEVDGEKG